MIERQEKIKLLQLKEKQRRELPAMLERFIAVTGIDTPEEKVFAPEKIETVFTHFKREAELYKLSLAFIDLNLLNNILQHLLPVLRFKNYFNWDPHNDIFMIEVETDFILTTYSDLLKDGHTTFRVYDPGGENLLSMSRYETLVNRDYEEVVELTIYGKEWIEKAVNQSFLS